MHGSGTASQSDHGDWSLKNEINNKKIMNRMKHNKYELHSQMYEHVEYFDFIEIDN